MRVSDQVLAAAFLGDVPTLALADGSVVLGEDGGRIVKAHPEGGALIAVSDGRCLYSGGGDGRVVRTRADGACEEVADENGRWIDALTIRNDGAIAWSAQKTVRSRDAKGQTQSWEAPSTVRGLAFLPKGYRLAASHYNGVSLWFPNAQTAPETYEWKGSHLEVTISPDGRFCVSAMQECALHGWRLADKANMRMTGYPAKTRSFSWSRDGQWLATSGADACIVWPFADKNGPMGQAPRECGARPARVTCVAFHPAALAIALGYADGWILLCRLTDGGEIPLRHPELSEDAGAITALRWDERGARLLFGSEDAQAGMIVLPVSS